MFRDMDVCKSDIKEHAKTFSEIGLMKYNDGEDPMLQLLDQTQLPLNLFYLELRYNNSDNTRPLIQFWNAIKTMNVRGAPAIGACAAFSLAAATRYLANTSTMPRDILERLIILKSDPTYGIDKARPTAVNLEHATTRMVTMLTEVLDKFPNISSQKFADLSVNEAERIYRDDIEINRAIGKYGAEEILQRIAKGLISPARQKYRETHLNCCIQLEHHCNTGHLVSAKYGTALGIVYIMQELLTESQQYGDKPVHVWVDETRPRLQGSRLTTWELEVSGIPHTLIVDSANAHIMEKGLVDAVVFGADRVALNGDVANKIGTKSLAAVAKVYGVPVFAAVPTSTICLDTRIGDDIQIEERDPKEVLYPADSPFPIANESTPVYNPAFDVTRWDNITGIITEMGVILNKDYPTSEAVEQKLREHVLLAKKAIEKSRNSQINLLLSSNS